MRCFCFHNDDTPEARSGGRNIREKETFTGRFHVEFWMPDERPHHSMTAMMNKIAEQPERTYLYYLFKITLDVKH